MGVHELPHTRTIHSPEARRITDVFARYAPAGQSEKMLQQAVNTIRAAQKLPGIDFSKAPGFHAGEVVQGATQIQHDYYEQRMVSVFPPPCEDIPKGTVLPKKAGIHGGLDINRSEGGFDYPILAKDAGVVIWCGPGGNAGNMVIVEHADMHRTFYFHMGHKGQPYTHMVKPGHIITKGQQIGTVGDTGNATGAHLHFMVVGYAPELVRDTCPDWEKTHDLKETPHAWGRTNPLDFYAKKPVAEHYLDGFFIGAYAQTALKIQRPDGSPLYRGQAMLALWQDYTAALPEGALKQQLVLALQEIGQQQQVQVLRSIPFEAPVLENLCGVQMQPIPANSAPSTPQLTKRAGRRH